jgi:hypothetical protein
MINPSPSFLGEMKVEDLLDLDFFEKCFFGKKLSVKDQIIFRTYARELLELIKQNINRQIAKKQRMLSQSRYKEQKSHLSKRQANSKSPFRSQRYVNYFAPNHSVYSFTPPPDSRHGRRTGPRSQRQPSEDNIS